MNEPIRFELHGPIVGAGHDVWRLNVTEPNGAMVANVIGSRGIVFAAFRRLVEELRTK